MGNKSHKLSLSKRVTKISMIDQLRGKKNEVSYRSVSKLCSRLKMKIVFFDINQCATKNAITHEFFIFNVFTPLSRQDSGLKNDA